MSKTKLPTVDMRAAAEQAGVQVEEANQYLTHISKMEIVNDAELRFSVGVVAEIKEKHTAVGAQRNKFTEKAQAIIDEAKAFFNPALNSLAECEKVIKSKIVDFDLRQADKRNDLILRAGDAGARGSSDAAQMLMKEADACIPPKIPGLSIRRSTKVEIHDAAEAIQWCIENDRLELLQLNEKAVKDLVKASNEKGGFHLPGVTIKTSASAAITVSKVEH